MAEENNAPKKENFLMYRGKPLVREKNAFCYGNLSDKHILFMIVLSEKSYEAQDEAKTKTSVPEHVIVQILKTDPSLSPHEKLVKQFDKDNLYDAMDIGLIWLDRLNAPENKA